MSKMERRYLEQQLQAEAECGPEWEPLADQPITEYRMKLSNQTKSRIEKYTNLGYQIIIGNNRDLPRRDSRVRQGSDPTCTSEYMGGE